MRSAKAAGCLVIGYGPLADASPVADMVVTDLDAVLDLVRGMTPVGQGGSGARPD